MSIENSEFVSTLYIPLNLTDSLLGISGPVLAEAESEDACVFET